MIDFRRWRYRDRLIVAFALAIAIHEIFLGLVHGPAHPDDKEDQAITTVLALETPRPTPTPRRTPRPTPTPRATPQPTPPPKVTPPPRSTPAPVQQVAGRAKGRPARKHGGGAKKAVAKARIGIPSNPNAAGVGTGTSTGTGSGATAGTGGGQGAEGTGNAGTGNGAVNADTPCGFVEFLPTDPPKYSNGTASERVRARVHFPDGHAEDVIFPYMWVYPNGEVNDPWSRTNLAKKDLEIPLQQPPSGADTSSYPPLIKYILTHSNAEGFTYLRDCPKNRG